MRPVFWLLSIVLLTMGCSVVMASKRSAYCGDPTIIQVGAERAEIEKMLGAPNIMVPLDNGRTKAVYRIDPYAPTKAARNANVARHIVADVLTLGLWEIVGSLTEEVPKEKFVTYRIYYDRDGRIEAIETVR